MVQLLCAETAGALDEMKATLHRTFDILHGYAQRGETPPLDERLKFKFQSTAVTERSTLLAARIFSDDDRLLVLLRGDDRNAFAAAERAQQDLVCDDVELLLLLALHIFVSDGAEHVVEPRAPHVCGDHLGRD